MTRRVKRAGRKNPPVGGWQFISADLKAHYRAAAVNQWGGGSRAQSKMTCTLHNVYIGQFFFSLDRARSDIS